MSLPIQDRRQELIQAYIESSADPETPTDKKFVRTMRLIFDLYDHEVELESQEVDR